jgi:hypothetical protein
LRLDLDYFKGFPKLGGILLQNKFKISAENFFSCINNENPKKRNLENPLQFCFQSLKFAFCDKSVAAFAPLRKKTSFNLLMLISLMPIVFLPLHTQDTKYSKDSMFEHTFYSMESAHIPTISD